MQHNHLHRSQHAFTLVELSIVLVVLGLLASGILAGQHLVKAAELRSVGKEFERYQQAVLTFKTKYGGYPGDITDATDYWNGVTENGNGDYVIRGDATADGGFSEGYMMWQHLNLAGLLEGNFTGRSGSSVTRDLDVFDVNVPKSSYSSAGWNIDDTNEAGNNTYFDIRFVGHRLELGGLSTSSANTNRDSDNGAILPEDARQIDYKLDDGIPTAGSIIARYWNNACTIPLSGAAANDNLDAGYNIRNQQNDCALMFVDPF